MFRTEIFIDATGSEHRPAAGEPRIVCLVPSITELLCDLGLGACLVGRTGFCVHPAETVAAIPKVGGTKDVRLDRVRRLAPTHAIVDIDENRRETAEALRAFVPHVIVTLPERPEDNRGLYRLFGGIFNRRAEAAALAGRFERAYETALRAARTLPDLEVLYLIWREPWMSVGPNTYISSTLRLFKLHTIPREPPCRYPVIDVADAMRQADLVLLSSEPYPFRAQHVEDLRRLGRERPVVRLIDGDMVCWYGSRAILGLEYLTEFSREHSRALT